MRSGDAVDRSGARRPSRRARASRSAAAHEGVGGGAGERLDAPHPRADAPLAGDHEAADLAGRPAVGAAAQLEAVALDADRADRLAVLLVEEGVGAALDRLGHGHERDRDRPILADDAGGPRPRSRAARRRSGRGRTGSRSAGSPGVTSEPAWRARSPTTLRSARWSRCVPVWLRIVSARRSASTTASTGSPTRSRPWSVPRWTIRPPSGRWVSVTVKSSLAAARLAEDAVIADLAAALGVERRPVEDDLGLAVAGQLVELHPVADDRDDAALGGRGLVAEESAVAGARLDRRRTARSARRAATARPSCPSGCGRAARRGPRSKPARSTRTPYSAASSTVRSIGKPYVSWSRNAIVAREHRRIGRAAPRAAGR